MKIRFASFFFLLLLSSFSHVSQGADPTPSYLAKFDSNDYNSMIRNLQYAPVSAQQCLEHYGEKLKKSGQPARLMGQRFQREGNFQAAEEWFNIALKCHSNRKNYTALAGLHLAMDNEDKWLESMLKILDLPFNRQNEADTNSEIARHFIDKGEWEKALPFQEAAAMRGYWKACQQASWLNAMLGNTARDLEIEEMNTCYNRDVSLAVYILAFGVEQTDWTHELLEGVYQKEKYFNDATGLCDMSIVELSRHNPEASVSLQERALEMSGNPWNALFSALICEENGWLKERDTLLQKAITHYPKIRNPVRYNVHMRRIVDFYIEANEKGDIDPALANTMKDHIKNSGDMKNHLISSAIIGELLRLKGKEELAKEVFKGSISVNRQSSLSSFMPYRGLRLMGEDPVKILNERRKQQM